MSTEITGRSLLLGLGVGNYNATMIIPYLFSTPMTTDPKSPMIFLLVKHIQKRLNGLGANLIVTGYLDRPTASAFTGLFGTDKWTSWSWSDVVSGVTKAVDRNVSLHEVAPVVTYPVSATGDLPFGLPDVPGGVLTYAAGAAALWYFLSKKKSA